MRILYLHPVSDDRGGNTCVATVDVELNDHVRLYGLRLMRMRDGKHLVYAPQAGQRRAATFSPALAEKLTIMAVEAMGNVNAA
ncbi:MAG: hypothetical protein ACOH2N_11210 [Devosia sp.]